MRVVVVKVKQGNSQEMVFRREGVWWRMVGRMAAHWAPHGFGQLGAVGRVARPWWPGGECDCQGGDNLAFPSNTLACSVLWPEAVARQGLWPGAGSDCQIAQEFFPLHSQDSGLVRK